MFTILIVQGTRKIAVQYAKRIVGNKQYGGVRQYIPLKVNAAGVMPIIFAQALMFIPQTVRSLCLSISSNGILIALSNYNSWQHNTLFGILIILFTYFYTAITVNPNQMADDMKKNGGFIPGVKPGRTTADLLMV
jgi:preprotein translocase subunit SecY